MASKREELRKSVKDFEKTKLELQEELQRRYCTEQDVNISIDHNTRISLKP